jgi:hypothetical protein
LSLLSFLLIDVCGSTGVLFHARARPPPLRETPAPPNCADVTSIDHDKFISRYLINDCVFVPLSRGVTLPQNVTSPVTPRHSLFSAPTPAWA